MQKPIKKIKNGEFKFNVDKIGAPYSSKGWQLESYTLTILNSERFITELKFSNGDVVPCNYPIPPRHGSIEGDLKDRRHGFHFGGFPDTYCFKSSKLDMTFIEKGSDAWDYFDPEMEKRPEVKEAILAFSDGEGKTDEEVFYLYRCVTRFSMKMPSSWAEFTQMQKAEAARYARSMSSAPSNKDEL